MSLDVEDALNELHAYIKYFSLL